MGGGPRRTQVARSHRGGATHNVLATFEVRIRFQIAPGTAAGLGIQGLAYSLETSRGRVVDHGSTGADGEIRLNILAILIDDLELRLMNTRYPLAVHEPLAPRARFAPWKKRLELLGYFGGYLTDSASFYRGDVNRDSDSAPLQYALLGFQLDRMTSNRTSGMHLDAELDSATQSALREDADGPTR